MSFLDDLTAQLRHAPGFVRAEELLAAPSDATLAAPALVRPLLTAALVRERQTPVLVVLAGDAAAERFARQLGAYLPDERVLLLPNRRDTPWSRETADPQTIGRRARALYALDKGRPVVVVAAAGSLLRALPPTGSQVFEPLELAPGATLDLEDAAERLARMGYERYELAEERGTFAVRGGTLDVFGADATGPVRAELFGDEIETLRRYVPSTQQAIADSEAVEIYPCREVRLGTRAAQNARRALETRALTDARVQHDLERIEEGVYFNGIEQYLPALYKSTAIVTDYVNPSSLVVVDEPRSLFDEMVRRHEEIATSAAEAREKLDGLFVGPAAVDLGGRQRLTFLSLLRKGAGVDAEVLARRPEVAGGEDKLLAGLRGLLSTDHRVIIAVPERASRQRISDTLVGGGITVDLYERGVHSHETSAPLTSGVVHLAAEDIPAGYVVPDARLAVVSVDDVLPRTARQREARSADITTVTFDFKPGDYVVHATHGIALFREMQRREVLGTERDYLVLEYAKGDRLYVPIEQLDRITKFVGAGAEAPKVTRLNTADWTKATGKARKAAKQLAFDLVDLYARRSTVHGFAYGADTPWQLEMEAAFPFEETPDQLAAIADVKADMEAEKPMDRLVCGDVGYGKTEVAIRAVFKAAQDGKQVIVLCPTTILAQQHYTTFSDRFAPFPVTVEVLSRFRSESQQKAALEGFVRGEVDVLIGTHRLLSRDVTPKNLGLVVIDEEQRFGVEHKEHMKNLREQVDVLTMTATPIPRTLQMSLSGVRDMSVIDTPPPNRFPVHVHVGEFDLQIVRDAIRRELQRGGQVYYVSNRVKSIDEAVHRVMEAVPEARVGVAHGQMSEKQLERVMEGFAACEVDVLVATTIVESGIDNPHSNTLVIEDSQRLGLAQLYQLKGRVGRSHVKAYAYFLFQSSAQLTDQAYERLTAIRDYADLGSGIKVALRDLEIRGAGNLLGAEQHGNMSAVGFDLYAQMIREAVAEARGEPIVAHPEVRVDLPVSAFLPEEYVRDVDDRVRFYRRIAAAITPEAIERVADELRGTHGEMPIQARNLVGIARIRAAAAELGVTDVSAVRHRITLRPVTLTSEQHGRAAALGAIYAERDRRVTAPQEVGRDPIEATLAVLNGILAQSRA